jgi:hypothetical protein
MKKERRKEERYAQGKSRREEGATLEDWPDGLEERCAQGKSRREEGATFAERLATATLEGKEG